MFFEAVLYKRLREESSQQWADRSTPQEFIFQSDQGFIRLRKRTAYPQTTAFVRGSKAVVGYGNVVLGKQIADSELNTVNEEFFHGDEFLYVEIDLATNCVAVQRDTFSTLPVFMGSQDDCVILASSHSRVIEQMDSGRLRIDHVGLIKYLCSQSPTHITFFKDVTALHDRMYFSWKKGIKQLRFAPHASIKDVVVRREGSISELRQQLEDTIETYRQHYSQGHGSIACEWSGGIDSALVTGYLADQGYSITTATFLLPGAQGASQISKQRDFTNRFKIDDTIVVQLDPNNYHYHHEAHQSKKWKSLYFHEAPSLGTPRRKYLEALSRKGFTAIFTGGGGDELCEEEDSPYGRINDDLTDLFTEKRKRPAPVWFTADFYDLLDTIAKPADKHDAKTIPPVSSSIAIGGTCGGNIYIEQGIWPVQPLADPKLYAYCQSLPLRYRVNKNLLKMYHEARQTPLSLYSGNNEDFCEYFHAAASSRSLRPIWETFMANSLLHKAGLIDKHIVMREYQTRATGPYSEDSWSVLHDAMCVLNTEIILQTSGVRSI